MSTQHSASAASTVVYCGDRALLREWRASAPLQVDILEYSQLFTRLQGGDSISAVILSFCEEQAGRVKIPADDATDLRLLELLEVTAKVGSFPSPPSIIVLTQSGLALDVCCALVQRGANHFIDMDAQGWEGRLVELMENSAKNARSTIRSPQALLDDVGIRAVSPAMQSLILQVNRAAQVSDATVLIHGESGTGKQLFAEAIHHLDPKRSKLPFVPVNCAAITGTLAESELFGHTKGAFSGATDPRLGYFRSANRGTIFLDEISELPLYLQPKLLRVLQERRVMPVGADKEEPIDVRVVAATNVSLQEKVAKGEFRLDLYQRLNVIHLALPPLRQRTEDIPLLVQHFVKKYQHYCGRPIHDVDSRVFELLKRKAGMGNVRELENIVRQSLVFKETGNRLELQDLPRWLFDGADQPVVKEIIPSDVANNIVELIRSQRLTLKQVIEMFEKTVIHRAAQAHPELSKVKLAKVLGLPRRTLYYKLDAEGGE